MLSNPNPNRNPNQVALAAAEAAAKSRMPIGTRGAGMPRPASSAGVLQRGGVLQRRPAGRAANTRLDASRAGAQTVTQTAAVRMERVHREAARTARRVAEAAHAPGSDEAAAWGEGAAGQGAATEQERRAHEQARRAALLGGERPALLRAQTAAQMRSILEARSPLESELLEKELDRRESALNVVSAGSA